MALYTVAQGATINALDINQFFNLVTGSMSDQPVTVANRIRALLSGAGTNSGYVGGTGGGAPTSGTFQAGDFIIDVTGQLWICTAGGTPGTWVSVHPNGAAAQANPAAPAGTTSTAGVMMGLAGAITPSVTGRLVVIVSGDTFNSISGDGCAIQIRYGTGTAPANGAALGGTAAGQTPKYVSAATAEKVPFSCNALITGLALNTALWLDLSLAAITGGTASVENVMVTAFEI